MNKNHHNILHLISALEVGGAEKLLLDLLKNSNSEQVNFVVVVMNEGVNETLKKELLETGYKAYFLNRKENHKHPKYFFELLKIIKQNNVQIIHSHNYGSKMWSILLKIFNPKIKTVFTVHDTKITIKMSKIEYYLHKNFIDINIAISKAVLKECLDCSFNNVIQIYNGIDVKKFIQCEKHENDIFKIINISRITHTKKGQDILIKALKICKDRGVNFNCDFVGGIYDYGKESFEYLKTLVEELELEKNIKFLGNREDIPQLLSQSDLFVLPSRNEGLGLVVLEAMASRVPVIASNIDGPAELIQNNKTGLLFESENYEDLAEKILYMYNNRDKMENFSKEAYEFVHEFDIQIMCKKYIELYEKLINETL